MYASSTDMWCVGCNAVAFTYSNALPAYTHLVVFRGHKSFNISTLLFIDFWDIEFNVGRYRAEEHQLFRVLSTLYIEWRTRRLLVLYFSSF